MASEHHESPRSERRHASEIEHREDQDRPITKKRVLDSPRMERLADDIEPRIPYADLMVTAPTTTDPACAMSVDPDQVAVSRLHDDAIYYYCNVDEERTPGSGPAKYLKPDARREHTETAGHDRPREQHMPYVREGMWTNIVYPVDPVCGALVDPALSKTGGTIRFRGDTLHFCRARCRRKFERSPEKYLEGRKL